MSDIYIEREVYRKQIVNEFDKVLGGEKAISLISGSAGIGKTHLFHSLVPFFYNNNATVINSKSVQHGREQVTAISKVVNDIITKILILPKSNYQKVISIYRDAMQKDLMYIVAISPQAGKIFNSVSERGSQFVYSNKAKQALIKFIELSATIFYPLVLHFDDLQWMDSLSLEMLNMLIEDEKVKLYVLLSFRVDEMDLSRLRLESGSFTRIDVQCFSLAETKLYLEKYMETHRAGGGELKVQLLVGGEFENEEQNKQWSNNGETETSDFEFPIESEQLHLLTDGNPFYLSAFLDEITLLEQRKQQVIDGGNLAHTFNIEQIIRAKIDRLSFSERRLVECLACFGGEATLSVLEAALANHLASEYQVASGKREADFTSLENTFASDSAVEVDLAGVANSGLIRQTEEGVFLIHDIVTDFIYRQIEDKNGLIVSLLNNLLSNEENQMNNSDIVSLCSQLKNVDLLKTDNRIIANIYQAANNKKNIAAFDQALKLFELAESIMPSVETQDDWFALEIDYMECLYLAQEFSSAKEKYNLIKGKANPKNLNRLNLSYLKCFASSAHWEMVLRLGEEILRSVGHSLDDFSIDENLERFAVFYQEENADNLCEKKQVDTETTDLFFVLLTMLPAANRIDKIAFQKIALKMSIITAEYALNDYSGIGYALAVYTLYHVIHDFESAQKLEDYCLQMLSKESVLKTIAYALIGTFSYHISHSSQETLALLEQAVESAKIEHEYIYSNYAIVFALITDFLRGGNLPDLRKNAIQIYQQSNGTDDYLTKYMAYVILSAIEELTSGKSTAIEIPHDRQAFYQTVYLNYDMLHLQTLYIMGDFKGAYELAERIEEEVNRHVGFVLNDAFYFYSALIRIACYQDFNQDQKERNLSLIKKHLKTYGRYAGYNNLSYRGKALLLDLEYSQKIENSLRSEEDYYKALALAESEGNKALMALINLMAARKHKEALPLAKFYAAEAVDLYNHWGAKYIAEKIGFEFGLKSEIGLLENNMNSDSQRGSFLIAENILLLQKASVSETVKLLADTIFEISSAERLVLLFEENNDYYIHYDVTSSQMSFERQKLNINHSNQIHQGMVRYVFRTQNTINSEMEQARSFTEIQYNRDAGDYVYVMPLFINNIMLAALYLEAESSVDDTLLREVVSAFSPSILEKSMAEQEEYEISILQVKLTKREQEIVELLVGGYSNKEISKMSFISEGTCRNHISNIYRKLHVKNRVQAVMLLKKMNL